MASEAQIYNEMIRVAFLMLKSRSRLVLYNDVATQAYNHNLNSDVVRLFFLLRKAFVSSTTWCTYSTLVSISVFIVIAND